MSVRPISFPLASQRDDGPRLRCPERQKYDRPRHILGVHSLERYRPAARVNSCMDAGRTPYWRAAETRGSLLQVVAKSGTPPKVFAQSESSAAQSPMFFGSILELIQPRHYRISRIDSAPGFCCSPMSIGNTRAEEGRRTERTFRALNGRKARRAASMRSPGSIPSKRRSQAAPLGMSVCFRSRARSFA